jgi:FAD binding domain
MPRIDPDARATAARCRHYAMCKIDYLGTGLCPSGPERHFVAYYPQGRMDLYRGLADGLIPVTDALLDSADTCTLCGICDFQCHFATGMQPTSVMRALKGFVEEHRRENRPHLRPAEDEALRRLRAVVGRDWATNDPAVLWTYADDPFPLAGPQMPRYVVLPGSREEVAAVVRLAGELGLPFAVRGNGGSVFGFVFTDGIVLDMNRMRRIEFDADNWTAAVEPGVTSFELQQEAWRRGFRINAAEPAATVCGNIVCTGTFSTWSNVYGTAADSFVDMEFVGRDGGVFRLNDKRVPNSFAFEHRVVPSPGICTKAFVKLHPMTDDEEGLLVPFEGFDEAVRFARELGQRRIGLALAVLGAHYIATFLTPDEGLAGKVKAALPEALGINYVVFTVADRFGRDAIRKMAPDIIDSSLLRLLMLGLPKLVEPRWLDLVREYEGQARPFELLCRPDMRPVIEAILQPSPETISAAVPESLRPFYRGLYARPEMTDMVWLNMHRIVSARMSRRKHMFAFLVYVPPDRLEVIHEILDGFARVADAHGIDHDFGFLTPMDLGKRAILEYDYYIDHTDPAEKEKVGAAMPELDPWLDGLAARVPGVLSLKYIFSQGCSRKDNFLYRI